MLSKEDSEMTERDRALAEHIGQVVIAKLLDVASDKTVATRVVDTWTGEVQRIVGRAVLRAVMWLAGVGMFLAAVKLGLWEKVAASLGVPKP